MPKKWEFWIINWTYFSPFRIHSLLLCTTNYVISSKLIDWLWTYLYIRTNSYTRSERVKWKLIDVRNDQHLLLLMIVCTTINTTIITCSTLGWRKKYTCINDYLLISNKTEHNIHLYYDLKCCIRFENFKKQIKIKIT